MEKTRRWSRREWLSVAAGCALYPTLNAADLSGFYYRDYSRCLPDYLSTLARAAYEKRDQELALLTTSAAIRKRQAWVRETFWRLVGGETERTPLNARVTGSFERSGYRVEKVIYESRPRIVVSANLYFPAQSKPPYPGVLFQMGHYYTGKAYASYQKCCQGLARLGYVVLAFDPMGQGERIAYPDASGTNTRLSSVDEEHSVPGKQFLLLGDTASRYQVWDAIRSLDYLASHPSVDPDRLASTGQSGGGTLTMLLACADQRLSAAAVCMGNTENFANANFNPPGSTDDAEQDLVGSGPVGFDRWDLLYPIAPKPLLVQVSAHDFFGTYSPRYLDDGREQYEKLLKTYEVLGVPDHLAWRSTPLTHGLSYGLRLEVYNWFERWLKNSDKHIEEEPPGAPEPASALWTGPTGSVVRDHQSLRPFDLIKRSATVRSRPASSMAWTQALPVGFPSRDLKLRNLAETRLPDVRVTAAEVNSVSEIWLPAWLFISEETNKSHPGPTLLVLDDRGRNAHAHEDDLYHRLAQSGHAVCAADIRGIGDSRPEVGRGNPEYTIPHDSEEDFAWASLILGNPLLAQRVTDILALAQALRNESAFGKQPLKVAARGRLTVPALFAFAASQDVTSLYLAGGLVSFRSLLETEVYRQSLANFAWGLFRLTDLPVIASQAAPRRIHIAGAVDASTSPVATDELRRIYPSRNVDMSSEPAWDPAALSMI
jgi:dienelactone hydrolase